MPETQDNRSYRCACGALLDTQREQERGSCARCSNRAWNDAIVYGVLSTLPIGVRQLPVKPQGKRD